MNKLRLGALLLAILLAASILTGTALHRIHTNIAGLLENSNATLAAESWRRWRNLTAAFADHEPLERMDQLFAQLEEHTTEEEYTMLCIQLSCVSKAIAESVELTWWNFL